MRRLFIFLTLLFFPLGMLHAEDISVEATVDASQITMGEAGQLTLTVHGVKDGIEPPQWPKVDGVELSYLGPSTSISIINGQYSSIHAYNYSIFPTKTGHFQIPALTVTIDGKTYDTAPITVDIVDEAKGAATPTNTQQKSDEVSIKDKLFVVVSTPQASVYLGQKVPLHIKLYVNQLPIRNLQFPKFEQEGFNMENFTQPSQYNEVLNGVNHTVVDFQTFLYPTRVGELAIGPMHVDGSLLYKTQKNNPLAGRGGLFNDDFFSGIFDSYQERSVTVNAQALKLNVLPLPEKGRPENFTGAVGQMDFTMTVTPYEVHVGDPVTVRMKLTGVANYKSLQMPTFFDTRFKTYDPVVKDEENGRVVEQVIIPNTENLTEVPAVTFNYFDPTSGEYKTITQGPFPLKVNALSKNQEFKAIGFADLSKSSTGKAVEQVDYVKQYVINPIVWIIGLAKKWQFWFVVFCFALVAGGWLVYKRFANKLESDTAFARRHKALKNAQERLKLAKKYLSENKPKDFYNALSKVIEHYIADKFHVAPAGLHTQEITALLTSKKVSTVIIDNIKMIYETASEVQYAAGQIVSSRMKEDLERLNLIITDLDKKL